jgi:transcriptional regulator with XRE-family HTH domain
MAKLTGLHRTEISLLERAGREPRLATLLKLAAALDTSLEALAEGITWEPAAAGEQQPIPPAPGRFHVLLKDGEP